jgi:hypothetical protein
MDWWTEYQRGYELVALADIQPGGTRFQQGAQLAELGGRLPPNSLAVLRRR